MAPFLCYFKLCASFRSHLWLPTGVILRKSLHWGKICFNLCDPYLWLLTFYIDNTFVNSKNSWTFHYDTMTAQSLDTDVQRPFYSVATVALLPYGKRTTVATLNKKRRCISVSNDCGWQEHCEKDVTGGRTERTILRAAWSQLRKTIPKIMTDTDILNLWINVSCHVIDCVGMYGMFRQIFSLYGCLAFY